MEGVSTCIHRECRDIKGCHLPTGSTAGFRGQRRVRPLIIGPDVGCVALIDVLERRHELGLSQDADWEAESFESFESICLKSG